MKYFYYFFLRQKVFSLALMQSTQCEGQCALLPQVHLQGSKRKSTILLRSNMQQRQPFSSTYQTQGFAGNPKYRITGNTEDIIEIGRLIAAENPSRYPDRIQKGEQS